MEGLNLINIYRFTRLGFWLTCSPFILNATVKVHVQNYINDETIRILTQFLRDLHVDDAATSFNSSSEELEFYSVCKQNLLKGGFQLRKWESNNINLQKNTREKETDNSNSSSNPSTDDTTYAQYQLGLNDPQFWKVLVMNWDIVRDQFQFSFEEICEFTMNLPFTKQNVLRISGMFYDRLGVIPHMVLQTRLLFKNVCNKK